ncbi:MAG TPA: hypothetical protein VGE74_01700 [Gemmata sp.]
MSRAISIWYRSGAGATETSIDVCAPYFLFGTQQFSMQFWGLPRLREIGISRLAELGVSDPVWFVGWDGIAELRQEIALLQEHLSSVDFYPELKASWLSHLVYCYSLLEFSAPKESEPNLMIG